MRLPKFNYHKPENLKEACSILKDNNGKAKVVAGGTGLLVAIKQGAKKPSSLVSLRGIEGLDSIEHDNTSLKIGSMCILQRVADSENIKKKFPVLSAAADSVASQQIRNMGTIGGNISLDTRCWYYNQTQLWRDARPLCFKTKGSVCHVIKGGERCQSRKIKK